MKAVDEEEEEEEICMCGVTRTINDEMEAAPRITNSNGLSNHAYTIALCITKVNNFV